MTRLLLCFCVIFSGCHTSKLAPYKEVTDNYQLPAELKGSKIYILGGDLTGTNPLWVVVSPEGRVLTTQ